MGFLKKLAGLFGSPAQRPAANLYPLNVECSRCGEIIQGQVNLSNDLSADFGADDAGESAGGPTTYLCRKMLIGKARCFQQIEVVLRFDANRKLIDRQISGGKFV